VLDGDATAAEGARLDHGRLAELVAMTMASGHAGLMAVGPAARPRVEGSAATTGRDSGPAWPPAA
jgi:hypothetical protein